MSHPAAAPPAPEPRSGANDLPPGPKKRGWGRRALTHLNREDQPLLRDGILALIAITAAVLLAIQQGVLDGRRADRQEMLENTRFVRQVAIDPATRYQPFAGLDLRGAHLAGLDLACRDPKEPDTCADLALAALTGANLLGANLTGANLANSDLTASDLTGANLNRANLTGANLTGANLLGANLLGADLANSDLTGANLSFADLAGADLIYANLTGANLTGTGLGANLTGANLTDVSGLTVAMTGEAVGVCYDEATRWPDGLTPQVEPDCSRWP